MRDRKTGFPILLVVLFQTLCFGQSLNPSEMARDAKSNQPSTFSSFNERIANYYAAAIKGNFFSSKEGEFDLNASLYGIRSVFNPDLNIDTMYRVNRFQRNLNIGFSVGMGDDAGVDRFGGKVRWAFINSRDRTSYNFGKLLASEYQLLQRKMISADSSYIAYLKTNLGDSSGAYKVFYDQYATSLKNYTSTQNPQDLEPVFRGKYAKSFQSTIQDIRSSSDSLAAEIDKRLLTTLELGGGYKVREFGYWEAILEAYHGVGKRGELKGTIGYHVSDSASTWSRFRWRFPVYAGYTITLNKTSESTIDLTVLAGTELSGQANDQWDVDWTNTYGLGLTLPIKKGFSLPILVKNSSLSAWHGVASIEISLNLEPN